MKFTSKLVWLVLLLLSVSAGIIVYYNVYEGIIAGVLLYTVSIVLLAFFIDRYLTLKDSIGVFLFALLSTILGSTIGAIIAYNIYSAMIALGVSISAVLYGIVVLKAYSR